MKEPDRLPLRTLVTWAILTLLTAVMDRWILGLHRPEGWPSLRTSIIMSTLTCLWSYTFWFCHLFMGD